MNRKRSLWNATVVTTLLTALAGCASTGEPQEEKLAVVQSIQVGDDALDCQSLQSQIFNAEMTVARLTQEVDSSKSSARVNDAAGAVNQYLGNSSLFNSLLATSARDSEDDAREIRDSYQRRRDILLQQYMHKKCSIPAQTQASS